MMKNILSLSEFERLCSRRGFSEYTFEQPIRLPRNIAGGSTGIQAYQSAAVYLSPNVIVFNNADSILYFRHVKYLRAENPEGARAKFEMVFGEGFDSDCSDQHVYFTAE